MSTRILFSVIAFFFFYIFYYLFTIFSFLIISSYIFSHYQIPFFKFIFFLQFSSNHFSLLSSVFQRCSTLLLSATLLRLTLHTLFFYFLPLTILGLNCLVHSSSLFFHIRIILCVLAPTMKDSVTVFGLLLVQMF